MCLVTYSFWKLKFAITQTQSILLCLGRSYSFRKLHQHHTFSHLYNSNANFMAWTTFTEIVSVRAWHRDCSIEILVSYFSFWGVKKRYRPVGVKLKSGGSSLPLTNLVFGSRSSSKYGCAHASIGVIRLDGVYSSSWPTKSVASGVVRCRKTLKQNNRLLTVTLKCS